MPYEANLIRACNGSNPRGYNRRRTNPRGNNRRRNVQDPPRPPMMPLPPPPPPPPEPGYILYGFEKNHFVKASIANGAIRGHNRRRLSPESLSTLHESRRKSRRARGSNNIISIYFDKDSRDFDWLHGGWLAEKRVTSGDNYRWLYYDPLGRQYRSKRQVLRFRQEQDNYFP